MAEETRGWGRKREETLDRKLKIRQTEGTKGGREGQVVRGTEVEGARLKMEDGAMGSGLVVSAGQQKLNR